MNTYICPDCGERQDDGEPRHPDCCLHEEVEPDDDGLNWKGFRCSQCNQIVVPTDGGWEVLE